MISPEVSADAARPGERRGDPSDPGRERADGLRAPPERAGARGFRPLDAAHGRAFRPGRRSAGLVAPLESYPTDPVPTMARHLERARRAEALGFAAIWLRDVPFDVPSFGDAGQTFDPFVHLGHLAARTERIALGVASVILPLRHPAHVAEAAASADVLSGRAPAARRRLGGSAGGVPRARHPLRRARRALSRERRLHPAHGERAPAFDSAFGRVGGGMDLLPRPAAGALPLLVTGSSRQDPDWIARSGDGWMTYPREPAAQARVVDDFRTRVRAAGCHDEPVVQPLYIDLAEDRSMPSVPIRLGFRLGGRALRDHLEALEGIGVNHVSLNLRFDRADVETTLHRLAEELLPRFPTEPDPTIVPKELA